jgi:hypothetical protein
MVGKCGFPPLSLECYLISGGKPPFPTEHGLVESTRGPHAGIPRGVLVN